MNTPINDGGPAFPHDNQELGGQHRIAQPGMSLRDWFAGMALQGIMVSWPQGSGFANAVEDAYNVADAMIAQREKKL